MGRIDEIESGRGGRFSVVYQRERYELSGPAELPWQHVMAYLDVGSAPVDLYWEDDLSILQLRAIGTAWARHHDLPTLQEAQRLCYLLDRYHDDLQYDLQRILQVDLDSAWRARRWRWLLSLADRLPRNCHFSAAVANDPEHADLIAKAITSRADDKTDDDRGGPMIQDWSPELEELTRLGEKIDQLIYATQVVAGGKNVPKPEPAARPKTAVGKATRRAERERHQAKHESLVARMLPHKAKSAE